MCHYITAVLSAEADEKAVASIMERHGRRLTPQENPGLNDQLRPGERYFLTTAGHCDCGTGLGAIWRDEAQVAKRKSSAERAEERLRKQGWSHAKIARWKADKLKSLNVKSESSEGDWESLLREILTSGIAHRVCLLLHWYNGSLSENIRLHARQQVSLAELSPSFLGRMQEDVLYEFKAQ